MRHKHADLIIEWANGAKIQNKSCDQWFDTLKPHWSVDREYRIKPEPKPDLVEYYSIDKHYIFLPGWEPSQFNNLKVTFDGETGELKAAEVLK